MAIVPVDALQALVGRTVVDLARRVPERSPPSMTAASIDSEPFRLATKAGLRPLISNVAIPSCEGGLCPVLARKLTWPTRDADLRPTKHKLWFGGPEKSESKSIEAVASSVSEVLSHPFDTAISVRVTRLLLCRTSAEAYVVVYTNAATSSNSTELPSLVGRGSVEKT